MKQSTFWREASRGGAIVGLVGVVFSILAMVLPKMNGLWSIANVALTIYLLFWFTRCRAMQFQQEGYSYGQSLGFIVAMSLFAGIIAGAYQIVASNWLFPEQFEQMFEQMLAAFAQAGISGEQAESIASMYRSMIFSPMPALFWSIFGSVIGNGFYGLFVAIATKREPALFDTEDEA